jgi:hypothetical protein
MKEVLNLLPVDETKNYLISVGQSDIRLCPTDALPKNKENSVGRHTDEVRAGARTHTHTHVNARTQEKPPKTSFKQRLNNETHRRKELLLNFIQLIKAISPKQSSKDPFYKGLKKAIYSKLDETDARLFFRLVNALTLINKQYREQLTPTLYQTHFDDYSQAFKLMKWKNAPLKRLMPKSTREILLYIIKKYGDKAFTLFQLQVHSKYTIGLIRTAIIYAKNDKIIQEIAPEKYQVIRFDF